MRFFPTNFSIIYLAAALFAASTDADGFATNQTVPPDTNNVSESIVKPKEPKDNAGEWTWKKDLPVWVNNFILLVTAVVALVNIAVVVWLFNKTDQERAQERAEDRQERNLRVQCDVGHFWISELILKSSNDFMHSFFDKYEQKISEFQTKCDAPGNNVDALRENAFGMISEFKQELHRLDKRVVEPLEWITPEFSKLRPILRDIEDLVTDELSTIKLPTGRTELTSDLKYRTLRLDFFKQLHVSHKKFMGI